MTHLARASWANKNFTLIDFCSASHWCPFSQALCDRTNFVVTGFLEFFFYCLAHFRCVGTGLYFPPQIECISFAIQINWLIFLRDKFEIWHDFTFSELGFWLFVQIISTKMKCRLRYTDWRMNILILSLKFLHVTKDINRKEKATFFNFFFIVRYNTNSFFDFGFHYPIRRGRTFLSPNFI